MPESPKIKVGQIWKYQWGENLCLVLILNIFWQRCLVLVDTQESRLVGTVTDELAVFIDGRAHHWELFKDV